MVRRIPRLKSIRVWAPAIQNRLRTDVATQWTIGNVHQLSSFHRKDVLPYCPISGTRGPSSNDAVGYCITMDRSEKTIPQLHD